jgi:hypothetical protein
LKVEDKLNSNLNSHLKLHRSQVEHFEVQLRLVLAHWLALLWEHRCLVWELFLELLLELLLLR